MLVSLIEKKVLSDQLAFLAGGDKLYPSEWARDRIIALSTHHRIVWVEDPYRLLENSDLNQLIKELSAQSKVVMRVDNAFRLREFLNSLPAGFATSFIIIDQSYTMRDPHQLPQDAKPSDLLPLSAPDWKPFVHREALIKLNVRDFLVAQTGFDDWPTEVNVYPYEKLARSQPKEFVAAYSTFRAIGRPLTSDDLILVGASSVLQINLFQLEDPLNCLELAFHSKDRWDELSRVFNGQELEMVNRHLRTLPKPLGDLFSSDTDIARAALTGMIILKQHNPDSPAILLTYASPVFSKYRDYDVPEVGAIPQWFVEEEVARFEKLCSDTFLKHIRDVFDLSNTEKAQQFGRDEKLSGKLRSLVAFEIEKQPAMSGGDLRDPFRLEHLVPEFIQIKNELHRIVQQNRSQVESLRLRLAKKLEWDTFRKLFTESDFYRIDRMVGRLQTLIQYVDIAARPQRESIPGFDERWSLEVKDCRVLIANASKLRDELDFNFGRMLEENYSQVVPGQVIPSDRFYEAFIAERRRRQDGAVQKAVILVIDSMRLDIWREIIRPALEKEYMVEEQLGFALLPSETRYSRRSFFAGKTPGAYLSSKESDLFAALLERVHGLHVEFEQMPSCPSGMRFGVRSRDPRNLTYAGVFDFPDVLSHDVDWDPHTLHESMRPLVNNIRAFIRQAGQEALIFITSDHGHMLQEKAIPVRVNGAQEGVGYRSAHVLNRIEGEAAGRIFQIEAQTLRHNASGWFVFPKPGFALKSTEDEGKHFKPSANYRHGGISMVEVVVPLACLRHRAIVAKVTMTAVLRQKPVVGEQGLLELSVSSDTMLNSPVFISADQEGVDSCTIENLSTKPQTVPIKYLPISPGKSRLTFSALLAGDKVGETSLSVEVAPAILTETDITKVKLTKLFGDD